ncbi:hypothetical protein [Mycobacterium spongiae]|uniref:hypothetical protein n=1 Tax=Mycobacterium spongiae TaxID=886343 RepID=UPI001BADE3CB|nr:hypothetical protein [Mycobacterium spongiae]
MINVRTEALLGRPLIGDGTNGRPGHNGGGQGAAARMAPASVAATSAPPTPGSRPHPKGPPVPAVLAGCCSAHLATPASHVPLSAWVGNNQRGKPRRVPRDPDTLTSQLPL